MTLLASDQPCPDCGHDTLGIYDDHTYCFHSSCGKRQGREQEGAYPPTNDFIAFGCRGIADFLVKEYRISGDRKYVYFPFFKQGRCVTYKSKRITYNPVNKLQWRGITKEESKAYNQPRYQWVGDRTDLGFYGEWNCRAKGDLLIVEGFEDVLAARQMMPHLSVVSVPDGADSLMNTCKSRTKFLNKFDNIYVCMDNDEAGVNGFEKARDAGVLPKYKTKVVTLPLNDVNEMLLAKRDDDFRFAITRAESITPSSLVAGRDLVNSFLEYLYTKESFSGISTGYTTLDALIGGFRQGELMTLVGGTGHGKTTFAVQLAANAIKEGMKCLFFSLETRHEQVTGKFLETLLEKPILGSTIYRDQMTREDYQGATEELAKSLVMTKHIGCLSSQELCDEIRAAKIEHGISLVVVDNITEATNTGEAAVKDIDKMMSDLNKVAGQEGLTILVLAQMSRSKEDPHGTKPDLSRVRNSEGINQSSHLVMALAGDRQQTDRQIVILKNHRIHGKPGTAYFDYDVNRKIFIEKINGEAPSPWNTQGRSDSEQDTPSESQIKAWEVQLENVEVGRSTVQVEPREECLGDADRETAIAVPEPEPDLAAVQDRLHIILRSGHPDRISERVQAIHRGERLSGSDFQNKTKSRQRYTSQLRLETVTQACWSPYRRSQEEFDHLRGMGNKKPDTLGGRGDDTG